jgi:hypothetical protein
MGKHRPSKDTKNTKKSASAAPNKKRRVPASQRTATLAGATKDRRTDAHDARSFDIGAQGRGETHAQVKVKVVRDQGAHAAGAEEHEHVHHE